MRRWMFLLLLGWAWPCWAGEFPASGEISDAAITEGEMKTLLEDWADASKKVVGGLAGTELTIASGRITPNRGYHHVDTQGGAALDYLDAIEVDSISLGHVLLLRITADARDVLVRHNQASPYISLVGKDDFYMGDDSQWLMLICVSKTGTKRWREIARNYGDGPNHPDSLLVHAEALKNDNGTWTNRLNGPRVRLTATTDATLASSDHAFQIGDSTGANIILDRNEILARNNGASTTLHLQEEGGGVKINNNWAWHAGNDTTGSGLNADQLDGYEASTLLDTPYTWIEGAKGTGINGDGIGTSWGDRDLTDSLHVGTGISVNLITDVITIPAGTYRCHIVCSCYSTGAYYHATRLYQTSGTPAALLEGTTNVHAAGATIPSVIAGRFTVASTITAEIQSRTSSAIGVTEGYATSLASKEVYTIAEFWKLD